MAKTIARMIKKGSAEADDNCGVRLAVIQGKYDLQSDFRDLHEDEIEVREFEWERIEQQKAENIAFIQGQRADLYAAEYQIPVDGINNLIDSDLWFIVSDRLELPLAPVKPFVVFATDYIQRYVPEIFPRDGWGTVDMPFLTAARMAKAVVVTTPQTRMDAISYAGVPASKVHLAPMDFDPTWMPEALKEDLEDDQPYFVWPTNPTQHKNHIRAFEALAAYYRKFDGKLNVRVTGANTHWLNPLQKIERWIAEIDHIAETRKLVSRSSVFKDRVRFMGELSDDLYAQMLANAEFLWHPTIYDNGTFAVAEAAWYGCPSLSSGYPQMRYIGERFSIPMEFFSARSVDEMARALKAMEEKTPALRKGLPDRVSLSQHSWEHHAFEYWGLLKGIAAQ